MDEESRYLWLAAFLDGIAGESGSSYGLTAEISDMKGSV